MKNWASLIATTICLFSVVQPVAALERYATNYFTFSVPDNIFKKDPSLSNPKKITLVDPNGGCLTVWIMETAKPLTPAQALSDIISSQPGWKFTATRTDQDSYVASGIAPGDHVFYTEARLDGKSLTTYMLENQAKLKPYYESVLDTVVNSFMPLTLIDSPRALFSVPSGIFHKSSLVTEDPGALLFESKGREALLQLTVTDVDQPRKEYLKGLPKPGAETVHYEEGEDWAFICERKGEQTTVKKLAFKGDSVAIATFICKTDDLDKYTLTIDILGSTLRHK